MRSADNSSVRVAEHHERRLARGEIMRKFYVREEHMETLRRFMVENGLPNQNSALQAMMDHFRLDHPSIRPAQKIGRNDNTTKKDRA